MFNSQPAALSRQLSDLRAAVLWQESLRQTLNAATPSIATLGLDQAAVDILRSGAPDKLAWQILDSSAAVTRTYALWEQAICDLVEEYVDEISKLHPTYNGLAEAVRINHRVGVGYILSKWAPVNTLFSTLSEDAIANGLVDGLRGNTYKLLTDAFLTDSDNYRADVVNRIFAKLGVENAFARACTVPEGKLLFDRITWDGDTPANYLKRIITERNEASHGAVSNISGSNQLVAYADFVETLCLCLATLLRTQIIEAGRSTGATKEVAVAVKKYTGKIFGSRASQQVRLEPGLSFFAGKGLIYEITIEELRIGNAVVAEINAEAGTEFGMRLNRDLPEGASLLVLS
ncbi:MAG: MAE_28990/MAE_18760 family HEPN-like nuclease [Patescibacteria group bacterium]